MADELMRPLGLPPPGGRRKRWPLFVLAAPLAVIIIGAGVVWIDRSGANNPPIVARIGGPDPTMTGSIKPAGPATLTPVGPGLTEPAPVGALTPVGKSGDVVIHDPNAPVTLQLAAAPRADLVETAAYGPIPKIGDDGTRPLDAYARPDDGSAGGGRFRVAIVIGGVGIDVDGEQSADALPGAVTLAIAPYGRDLRHTLDAARASGHEVLLQIPLEPYDYPNVNPGPKTLTVAASPAENVDRLHWLMSRITTYVGVVNYMGARFSSEAASMTPVLNEIGRRGLLYLDDGSSARSTAADVAKGVPFLSADIVLDADTDPAAIDQRLDQLAAIARQRGYAIATGSAFPATIDRVAAFAKGAAKRGIAVVPITALLPGRT